VLREGTGRLEGSGRERREKRGGGDGRVAGQKASGGIASLVLGDRWPWHSLADNCQPSRQFVA